MIRLTHVLHLMLFFLICLTACNTSGNVVATGTFTDKGGQHTSGTYRIEKAGDQLTLILSEDFRTDEGPDLHVVLTPTATDVAENETAMANGNALVIAPLESLSGEQQYELPADVDLSLYKSVVIHCIEFTHLYGAAPL